VPHGVDLPVGHAPHQTTRSDEPCSCQTCHNKSQEGSRCWVGNVGLVEGQSIALQRKLPLEGTTWFKGM
jgi:hypothetical protein